IDLANSTLDAPSVAPAAIVAPIKRRRLKFISSPVRCDPIAASRARFPLPRTGSIPQPNLTFNDLDSRSISHPGQVRDDKTGYRIRYRKNKQPSRPKDNRRTKPKPRPPAISGSLSDQKANSAPATTWWRETLRPVFTPNASRSL